MELGEVTLEGKHVLLEPLRPEHTDELWSAANDPLIWQWMSEKAHSREELARWIGRRRAPIAQGAALPFLQRDARTGQAFGSTSLFDIEPKHRRLEIGHTWIGASHRRTAANTEAKLLLLRHAFEALGAIRVQFKTGHRNERSQRAIERLGATREGVLRQHMILPDGSRRDSVIYSILDSEWPAVQARLERFLAEPRK